MGIITDSPRPPEGRQEAEIKGQNFAWGRFQNKAKERRGGRDFVGALHTVDVPGSKIVVFYMLQRGSVHPLKRSWP